MLPSYPRPVACVQELNFKRNWSPAGVKTGKLTVLANWYACIPPGSGSMPWAWESQQTGHESRGRQEGCPIGLRPGLDVQVSLWLSQVRGAQMHSGPGCCSVGWRLTAGGPQLRETLRKPPAWNPRLPSSSSAVPLVWGVDGVIRIICDVICEQGAPRVSTSSQEQLALLQSGKELQGMTLACLMISGSINRFGRILSISVLV